MQLRTGHPPSWAVAPWPWPHSSPPFAAPHAACVPPPPCACACGRRRPAVRRVRRRGDAALEDGRLNGVRRLESVRVVGGRTEAKKPSRCAGGRVGRPPRTRRPPAAELMRRVPPGEWYLFHLHAGRCFKLRSSHIPAGVQHRSRSSFGNEVPGRTPCRSAFRVTNPSAIGNV